MLISAVIPTYKREHLLREAVESVLSQETAGLAVEVVVINDSGEPLAPADWQRDPRVRIAHTYHTERSIARNTGAALSQGDYLHFLDDDDIALPGAYAALAGMVHGAENTVLCIGAYEAVFDDGAEVRTVMPVADKRLFALIVAGTGIPLGACLVQRRAFFSSGGFDFSLTVNEDMELLQRVVLLGPVVSTDRVVARFRMSRHALSTTAWDLGSQACRHQREKAFAMPDCLRALERSLSQPGTAFVRGRLTRFYLGSAARHARTRSLSTAAGRVAAALRLAIPGVMSRDFWRGLRSGMRTEGALAAEAADSKNRGVTCSRPM